MNTSNEQNRMIEVKIRKTEIIKKSQINKIKNVINKIMY